jgi:hypothetical protein
MKTNFDSKILIKFFFAFIITGSFGSSMIRIIKYRELSSIVSAVLLFLILAFLIRSIFFDFKEK